MTAKPEPTGVGGVGVIAAFCGVMLALGKAGGWVQRLAEEQNGPARNERRP